MDWNTEDTSQNSIQTSALMRIADATEAMAQNFIKLQKDVEFWKQQYYKEKKYCEEWRLSSIAYKAHFTRLKNKLEALENDGRSNGI